MESITKITVNEAEYEVKDSNALAKSELIDLIYPVGSIYMSVNNISPSQFLGGSWEAIENKFLLSAGSTYQAGSTGGSADSIIPYHTHTMPSGGAHTHTATASMPWGNDWTEGQNNWSAKSTATSSYSLTSTIASSGAHSHTINYAGTSGNTKGANMPPYIAVYMWKRVE